MKCSQVLSIINGLMLSTNVVAYTISPYGDFALNAHWEPKIQQIGGLDVVTPALEQDIQAYHLVFATDNS
ncbi:hypothetical protein [Legionella sp. km772]|uniref:hypothetical protein n=1 Tax=Legionella sp. km772 TaxID=2498111 RepID=UPI000F8F4868|nr:hypothetical protein [Legionella sp. km772]RUR06175.1 hypothetical protein ELY15_13480 [Legionella sp. km772]